MGCPRMGGGPPGWVQGSFGCCSGTAWCWVQSGVQAPSQRPALREPPGEGGGLLEGGHGVGCLAEKKNKQVSSELGVKGPFHPKWSRGAFGDETFPSRTWEHGAV